MIDLQHPRDSFIENVEKMIHCGDPAFGGAIPASVQPAATCTPLTGLLPCLL